MTFGLRQSDVVEIVAVLKRFPKIDGALIFGSRAKGNHQQGSDVDIAVKGEQVTRQDIAAISVLLNEESSTPYFFDVVHYETITDLALREHIDRVGQTLDLSLH
mgnify:CR=1 FL=1